MRYLVAMTKPNHEGIAATHLKRQGYAPYCPKFLHRPPNKPPVVKVLFPRYIFIGVEAFWNSINGTRGISYLLEGSNDCPQFIPTAEIEKLRKRENEQGLVQLAPQPKFEIGSSVKASSGPLMGTPMVYDGMLAHDRVRVLFEMLGQTVSGTIDERLLVAA